MQNWREDKARVKKSGLFQVSSPSLREGRGVFRQTDSLVSVRKFKTGWFEIPLLGET